MKYRPDPDLEFLKDCSSGELDILVNVLLRGEPPRTVRKADNMSVRDYVQVASSGQRSSNDKIQFPDHPLYKTHAPDHARYWDIVAGEIQRLGANQLALVARRGLGAFYIKILEHVCGIFAVEHLPDSSAEILERELCVTLFSRAIRHIPGGYLPVLWNVFDLKPDAPQPEAFVHSLVEGMRFDDDLKYLMIMCVAHGAAMRTGNIGYGDVESGKYRAALELFEAPLTAELDTIPAASRTGLQYWLLVPTVLQIACLRVAQNVGQD